MTFKFVSSHQNLWSAKGSYFDCWKSSASSWTWNTLAILLTIWTYMNNWKLQICIIHNCINCLKCYPWRHQCSRWTSSCLRYTPPRLFTEIQWFVCKHQLFSNDYLKSFSNTLIEEHSGRVQVGLPVHLLVLIFVEGGVLLDCVVRFLDLWHLHTKDKYCNQYEKRFTLWNCAMRKASNVKLFPIDHHLVLEEGTMVWSIFTFFNVQDFLSFFLASASVSSASTE